MACCSLMPTASGWAPSCWPSCVPVRPPSHRSGWRMTCCSSAARPPPTGRSRSARGWRRCARAMACRPARASTTNVPASAASTRPWWRRRASAWPLPRRCGRRWRAAMPPARTACPSSLRWSAIRWPGSTRMAPCWAARCRWPPPTPWLPVASRPPSWRWRWPPHCCTSTRPSRTATSTTPTARPASNAWPSASTRCARRATPARSICGWRSCTAASPTARPWAAWCRNCAPRCPRSRRTSTSTSATRPSARC